MGKLKLSPIDVRETAEAGNVSAMILLGDLYSSGDAGPVDGALAIQAYETAAATGSDTALMRLGDLFRDGKVVPADGSRAAEYYVRAATGAAAAATQN